ncbi:hypothetical protein [Luteolibacter soli]|uniref:Uncharacterized protein n=1 Tax=Luteolibacter soli TaxID=3135280 RepID=A0ABU9AVM4_9BACT
MIAVAMLFGFAILMLGSDVAAIQGGWARRLELPGSWFIDYAPWVALAVFVLAVMAIVRFKVRWRWAAFVAAYVLGIFIDGYPMALMDQATRIRLGARMNEESRKVLAAKYPDLKWVSPDSSGVWVRRDAYSPELAAFVTGLVDHQEEGRGGTAH